MDKIELLKKLFKFGWSLYSTLEDTINNTNGLQLSIMQKLYAAFHGLSSLDDVFDHVREPRFCNHPDTMQVTVGGRCKWPDGKITWDVIQTPSQFTKQRFVECITEAFKRWADVSGITPMYSPGDPRARITIQVRQIDGAFGVLAESELPCGNVARCNQWYDTGENWGAFDGPTGQGDIDIIRVATHELGHALGMNHIGAGNLLAPTYARNIWLPQAGDIAEMVARYGKPSTQPPPIAPPVADDFIIRFNQGKLSVDGYRLTKLSEAA